MSGGEHCRDRYDESEQRTLGEIEASLTHHECDTYASDHQNYRLIEYQL
jgi:hypothetical protein